MWTATEICSTPKHINKNGIDACVLDCRVGITSTGPIAPICAPCTLAAAQEHTTTHCMYYREQPLDPAPLKADPARLLTNSTFTCGTREKRINKTYWNTNTNHEQKKYIREIHVWWLTCIDRHRFLLNSISGISWWWSVLWVEESEVSRGNSLTRCNSLMSFVK